MWNHTVSCSAPHLAALPSVRPTRAWTRLVPVVTPRAQSFAGLGACEPGIFVNRRVNCLGGWLVLHARTPSFNYPVVTKRHIVCGLRSENLDRSNVSLHVSAACLTLGRVYTGSRPGSFCLPGTLGKVGKHFGDAFLGAARDAAAHPTVPTTAPQRIFNPDAWRQVERPAVFAIACLANGLWAPS